MHYNHLFSNIGESFHKVETQERYLIHGYVSIVICAMFFPFVVTHNIQMNELSK